MYPPPLLPVSVPPHLFSTFTPAAALTLLYLWCPTWFPSTLFPFPKTTCTEMNRCLPYCLTETCSPRKCTGKSVKAFSIQKHKRHQMSLSWIQKTTSSWIKMWEVFYLGPMSSWLTCCRCAEMLWFIGSEQPLPQCRHGTLAAHPAISSSSSSPSAVTLKLVFQFAFLPPTKYLFFCRGLLLKREAVLQVNFEFVSIRLPQLNDLTP